MPPIRLLPFALALAPACKKSALDCETASGGLTLNEVLFNPEGADEGADWTEIGNSSGEDRDLTGWWISWMKSSSSTYDSAPLPEDTVVPAGGYLVVGGGDVDLALDLGGGLGNGTGGDGVFLVDCEGKTVDSVVYASDDNSDGIPDDTSGSATSLAPVPSEGSSIGRVPDGADTDLCADDFAELTTPSPGEANSSGGGR